MTPTATALGPPLGATPDSPGLVAWYAEGFSDRLGDRLLLFDNLTPGLELLRFRDELAAQPGFEAALRARVDALASFRHPLFTRIRSVTHLEEPRPQLALVSELPAGERLSTILRAVEYAGVRPEPGAVVWLLRQVLPALTALHETQRGVASALLTPERLFVRPDGSLMITEYALGDALSALGWTPAKLWTSLGIPLRPAADRASIDPGGDVTQLALTALALLRGRLLGPDDFPASRAVVERACDTSFSARLLRHWLTRALVPGEPGFTSAAEALAALDEDLPGVIGTWSPTLLPHALPPAPTSENALIASHGSALPVLPPVQEAPQLIESSEATDRARVPAPLVRLLGTSISAGRLWRLNAILAVLVCLEAAALVTFVMRVGTGTILIAPIVTAPVASNASIAPAAAAFTADGASAFASGGAPADKSADKPDALSLLATAKATEPANLRPQAVVSPVIGWLQVDAPVEVKVYANGRLLGTGTSTKFRLPAGRHLITLANEERGVRSSQPVEITGGRTVLVVLDTSPAPAAQ